MEKLYLISQDVGILLEKWARRKRFKIPEPGYFDALVQDTAADIQTLFDKNRRAKVKIIFAKDLVRETKKLMKIGTKDFIVSLDRAYFDCDYHLELSRAVRYEGSKWISLGECPRPGCKPLEEQIADLANKTKGKQVIIVDDGCWTGGSIKKITQELQRVGVHIKGIVFGIMIDRGKLKIDAPLNSVHVFPEEKIIDWICERDFVPGTPLGGKTVLREEGLDTKNIGAYYLFGMGDYEKWASFKNFSVKQVKWFTRRRLHQATRLFEKIESLSGRSVLMKHIDRIPYGFDDDHALSFVNLLRQKAKEM